MANRNLINDLLGVRWNVTHAPAAGATVIARVAGEANRVQNLEFLWYSIRNMTGAGALQATVTVSVRHDSFAGTVIASVDHLILPSTTANVSISNMGIFSKVGRGLQVTMDTVVASLTQKVSMAGWAKD